MRHRLVGLEFGSSSVALWSQKRRRGTLALNMVDEAKPTIHVFGSLNMDLVCQTARLPQPGETVSGNQFQTVPGGKGANQAVAAARLGANTTMVGRVGDDEFGQALIDSLKKAGVDTHNVIVDQSASTGVALIVVDESGNNQIVVVSGANGKVDENDVQRLAQQFQPGDFLLLQFEVPVNVVMAAIATAKEKGVTVIMDPAPVQSDLPERFFALVDVLTPNQVEASQLVGFPVTDAQSAADAAQALVKRGVNLVMVKLGADGVVVATKDDYFHQPAFAVEAIDTVAAGDAFNGGLAVALVEGMTLAAAGIFASAVAACSVTQQGAQSAMPTQEVVKALLKEQP
jgi:ribokinase